MPITALGKVFDPPRPGAWEIDLTHFPRPATRFVSDVFMRNFGRGFAEGTKMYGLLLDRIEYAPLHGFMYSAIRPVGAPEGAKGPPPKAVFKLMSWLHPEMRRRIRRSKEVLEQRAWLSDLAHWDDQIKPQAIRENLELQRVDPRSLPDAALLEHVRAARQNAETAIYRHGRFTITCSLPVGDYLAHATEWTGEPVHALLRPVKGYSAVSNGIAQSELERLASLLREDARGAALLDSGSAQEVLSALRAADGALGDAARAWLDTVGYRMVTGYDLSDRFALELPQGLVDSLRAAVAASGERESPERIEADVAALRERVPAKERARFDELLADARALYRLRDERDHYNDGWATGLLRRAALEAGRRLAESGRLATPELFIDAGVEEMIELLQGRGPSSDELGERAEWRRTADASKAPLNLGLPPSPPPPADWLPPHAARLARGVNIFLNALFQPTEKESDASTVRGIPVSAGVYTGPARIVLGPDDFAHVKQGDVLVARSTSPYFNVLLPLLGAIVTDRGGALSHAAIVAREYGIPGVVGTKTGTQAFENGMPIRVDGAAGEVRRAGS
jgi:rifampicin phosphotransferase